MVLDFLLIEDYQLVIQMLVMAHDSSICGFKDFLLNMDYGIGMVKIK
jgi:hypothetical protein